MSRPGDVLYWDACVLLAWLNGEPGRQESVQQLLEEADAGEVTIYTSVLSMTEVAFAANEMAQGVDPRALARIDALWQVGSPIT